MLTKQFLNSLRQSFNRRNGYILYNTAAFTNNYIRISDKCEILRSTNKLQIQDTYVSNISIIYRMQLCNICMANFTDVCLGLYTWILLHFKVKDG